MLGSSNRSIEKVNLPTRDRAPRIRWWHLGSVGAASLLLSACPQLALGAFLDVFEGDLAALEVEASTTVVGVGSTLSATATGTTEAGEKLDVSSYAEWSSSDSNILWYVGDGKFEASSPGTVWLRARSGPVGDGVQVEVVFPIAPETPGPLTVGNPSPSTLDVSWGGVTGASSYLVYRDTTITGAFDVLTFEGSGTSFTDIDLEEATTYYYKVQAANIAGTSALSDAVSGATILMTHVYMRSSLGEPFSSIENPAAMDTAFGVENWRLELFESATAATIFLPYTLVFMDGSDQGAGAMETFLAANIAAIETWASEGGLLFLNSAPNVGDGMSFGFGDVTLAYPGANSSVDAADSGHPIFAGLATSYTGGSFSHAYVTGTGISAILIGVAVGQEVLSEIAWGQGHVLFGSMTTPNYHSPLPDAQKLRVNMLSYLRSQL